MKQYVLFLFIFIFGFSICLAQKKTNLVGTWQCISFDYKKAGTNQDFELSRSDFESLVKFNATYTFDGVGRYKFNIGEKQEIGLYDSKNNKLLIGEEGRQMDAYQFKINGDMLQLVKKNKTFDLTLNLKRIK